MSSKSLEERQAEMRQRLTSGTVTKVVVDESPKTAAEQKPIKTFKKTTPDTSISRTDLYELAWSIPMVKLAERFGVSDVAVAKACRKHSIPLPGRGYWACVTAGQKLRRT